MITLGINAYHGDAAACILKDGEILAACEEERFNRIKHSAGFPTLAIQACLKSTGLSMGDITHVSISRNPKANMSQKALYAGFHGKKLSRFIKARLSNALKIVSLRDELKKALKATVPTDTKIHQIEHHVAHMASCFFPSPFERAAILSIDGFGDFISTKWGCGEGDSIQISGQVPFPHSVGIFYTAFAQYLGFPNYGDEYKVMALAAFGKPQYQSQFREIISPDSRAGFRLNLDYFTHHSNGVEMTWERGYPVQSACFSQKLIERFGPPRCPEEPITDYHRDLAASLQNSFEEVYFYLLNMLYKKTRMKNLAIAGGCAFNSAANGKIREQTPFQNIFIQPAAGDAGTALGSALYVQHSIFQMPRRTMCHPYLGPDFTPNEVRVLLEKSALQYRELNDATLVEEAATALASGKIVGWFQGRMEYGPRALGNRSLLGDPRRKEMRDVLNERIKHREAFRPFAPSILAEEASAYFEKADPNPFMTCVFRIKREKRALIPAVTHVDGTGRLQTVDGNTNPRYYALIAAFKRRTGIPILLNTSFNENEPIVCTPQDALQCFSRTEMDCLAIGNFWLERAQVRNRTKPEKLDRMTL